MVTMNPISAASSNLEVTSVSEVKWFAGMAMQAFIAKQGIPELQSAREEIALWAFRMAQSMITISNQLLGSDSIADSIDPEC